MWLRLDMPTDPRLRINVIDRWVGIEEGIGETLTGRVWVEQDSASAHEILFRTEPAVFVADQSLDDLPVPYESGGSRKWGVRFISTDSPPPPARVYGWETFEDFQLQRDLKVSDSNYSLIATYRDDLGLLWESRRSIRHEVVPSINGEPRRLRRRGDFARRITAFPAKRALES